jgi:hypothetical protein
MPVNSKRHEVTGAKRNVRVEERLLRDIPDRAPPAIARGAEHDSSGTRTEEAEDHPKEGRFSSTIRADEAAEGAGLQFEGDVVEDSASTEIDAEMFDSKRGAEEIPKWRVHSFSVETFWVIAFLIAFTSASIQDW